jgi:hypothetical protein
VIVALREVRARKVMVIVMVMVVVMVMVIAMHSLCLHE